MKKSSLRFVSEHSGCGVSKLVRVFLSVICLFPQNHNGFSFSITISLVEFEPKQFNSYVGLGGGEAVFQFGDPLRQIRG